MKEKDKKPGEETSWTTGAAAIIERGPSGNMTGIRPKSRKTRHRQHAFLLALEKTFNNVSQACALVRIDRSTHYEWLEKYPDYKEAYEKINHVEFEFVHSKAMQRVNEGSDRMIEFMLRTKFKGLGYGETPLNTNLNVTINEVEIPDDEMTDTPEDGTGN